MPFKSKAQAALFHAAAADPKIAKERGIKQSAAKKFIADSHGQKVGKLPEHVKPVRKAKGGAVHPCDYQRKAPW